MTLEATTARTVTFSRTNRDKVVTDTRKFPAGTSVYARERRNGTFDIRICGTRYRQNVYADTLRIP